MANDKLKEWYVSNFETYSKKLNGESNSKFHSARKTAIEKMKDIEFPTIKHEEWKYTNVKPILETSFVPAVNSTDEAAEIEFDKYLFDGFEFNKIVFINGKYSEKDSSVDSLPEGVVIDSLANVLKSNPEIVEKTISSSRVNSNIFNELNTAFASDGLFVYLPKNKVVEKPLQVVYYTSEEDLLVTPRNVIVAEGNSQAKIIQNFVGATNVKYFNNIVSDVQVAENANVQIYKIQNESLKAFHIERLDSTIDKLGVLSHYSLTFGASLTRNDVNSELLGEFSEMNMYGLYIGSEDQHMDNHTFVDHAVPNCESNELYKGILQDKSHGVFNGKILVRKDAQKTNAFQSNKTILLSETANIDTKPQLEIYADDVKCSHGATIGQLDETADFYLRSRGVPADIAKSMLIRAFANDVIESVKIDSLKDQLNHMIFEHLNRKEV